MDTKLDTKVLGYDVIGRGEMIDCPMQVGDWWCVPLDQYKGIIPEEGKKEMERILKSDIKVKGFIVADDIRKMKKTEIRQVKTDTDWDMVLKAAVGVAAVVCLAVSLLALIAVVAMVGSVLLLGSALAYDPVIIAVTEDGWIFLYEWYE